jgi:hypothetical protein
MRFLRSSYDLQLSDLQAIDTVTVKVGAPPSTFRLSSESFRSTSEFFRNALKSVWHGPQEGTISLPDVEPAVFDLYARWLACGAEILVDEDDWKAEYTEYTKWLLELEDDKDTGNAHFTKEKFPVTVWDFGLSTKAWLLGDFLMSPAFQNNCLGHLYYMNKRFDHILCDLKDEVYDIDKAYWHWGTVAYMNLEDIVMIWENFESDNTRHPLKEFLLDWLLRYWDAYDCSDWDDETLDGIDSIVRVYPDLGMQLLRGLMVSKQERRKDVPGTKTMAFWYILQKRWFQL